MGTTDPRVDQYIAKANGFANPILKHLREMVHQACPNVEESLKWRFPHFGYKGMMCGMAAFKQHCTFGFWKDALLRTAKGVSTKTGKGDTHPLDQLGTMRNSNDLPPDRVILGLIKEAVRLNDEGVKVPKQPAKAKAPLRVPADFNKALKSAGSAKKNFDGMSPSHKREYVEWIIEAKADETRQRRIATAVEWIGSGKHRNWKYEKRT